jgi:UDP-N-acetylmuramyl tripeptide synthase
LHGLELDVRGPGGRGVITSSLVGDFNAENLLLALGALIAWDVPLADACELLGQCSSLAGRMQLW